MLTRAKFYLTIGVLFSFAAVVSIEEIRLAAVREDLAKERADYLQYQVDAEKLQRDALAKAAAETERRLKNQETIINDHQQTIEKLRDDYRNANAISQRLRDRIKTLTTSNSSDSTNNSTSTGSGETKTAAERIGELASLVDETAGILARELDEAVTRGRTCETIYQSLNEGKAND